MDEDEGGGPAIVIKRKNRPSKNTTKKPIRSRNVSDDDAEEQDTSASVVIRDRGNKKKNKQHQSSSSSTSTKEVTSTSTNKKAFTIKDPIGAGSSEPPIDLSQATISSSSSSSLYSKENLSALKAANLSVSSRPAVSTDFQNETYDELTMSKFGDSAFEQSETLIPTSSAIAEAKAKRAFHRKHGTDPLSQASTSDSGFIPLDVAAMPEKKGESRLVREDDEVGDAEEDHAEFTGANESIPLGRKAAKRSETERRRGMQDLIDEAENEVMDEDDEESRAWEEAQMKAGVYDHSMFIDQEKPKVYKPAPIPQSTGLPSLDFVQGRLTNTLKNFEKSHKEQSTMLQQNTTELEGIQTTEAALKEQLVGANDKQNFFEEFRNWVEDIALFLEVKRPQLDTIIKDNVKYQRERLQLIQKRRSRDDMDDIALFCGIAISDPEEQEKDYMNEENGSSDMVQELSGVQSEERQRRRQARRIRQSKNNNNVDYTDDELDEEDSMDLKLALNNLKKSKKQIFDDVESSDYIDPSQGISPRFVEWKRQFPELYKNAFAGLAMVDVLEFWAAHEMTPWNPFATPDISKSPFSFLEYSWHSVLSAYHDVITSEREQEEGQDDDQEEDLTRAMVSKVVVSQLRSLAAGGYDPLSSRATKRAVEVVEEISLCIDTEGVKFKNLVRAFLSQFQEVTTQTKNRIQSCEAYLYTPQSVLGDEGIEARNRLTFKTFKLITNALRWQKFSHGVILPHKSMNHDRRENDFNENGDNDVDDNRDQNQKVLAGGGMSFPVMIHTELLQNCTLPLIEAGWNNGGREIAVKIIAAFAPFANTPYSLPENISKRLRGMSP